MRITATNETALMQAAEAIVGPEAAIAIIKLYQLIDKAMHDGYTLGLSDGEQDLQHATAEAFDNGLETGWDDGYMSGVDDARRNPTKADNTIVEIISDAASYALNGEMEAYEPDLYDAATSGEAKVNAWPEGADWSALFDEDNVQDSGDVN
jgi:hypothetical protein